MSSVLYKIKNWEFWPMHVFYIPVYFYWLTTAVRCRALFFFNAVNPGIKEGGMMNDPKIDILEQIPRKWKPVTHYCYSAESVKSLLPALSFPLIVKPNVGERGKSVAKIGSVEELLNYVDQHSDFLIQEYIDMPLEAGIFYYRMPSAKKGTISSIVIKEFLGVEGDGISTVQQLMEKSRRKQLYIRKIPEKILMKVPATGEKLVLEPIGNHNRGTTFLNGKDFISKELITVIDDVASCINEFYYGRFDIRFRSWERLIQEKEFKILEVNGAKAEPAHIYHPGTPIWEAYITFFKHWKIMSNIALLNYKRGVRPTGFWSGIREIQQFSKRERGRMNKKSETRVTTIVTPANSP